jgi:predicted amidophosphoribosyltransferase
MAAAQPALRALSSLLRNAAVDRALPLWRSLARATADTVFPPACLNCRQSTGAMGSLCAACWAQVRFIERPFCERLGTPFAMDLGSEGLLSPEAVANPPVFARARAVAHFEDGPVRQLVHRLKYSDRMELAKPLGAWMARAGNELLVEADLLVPVPLHRRRLAARRFNQANSLAQAISAQCGVPVDPFALARVNICFLFSCKNNPLGLKLANLPRGFANRCSRNGPHRVPRHVFSVGAFDVSLNPLIAAI